MNQMSPAPSPHSAQLRLAAGLALPSRVRYTALLLAAIAMAGITGTLAFTEVGIPFRTRASLVGLSLIGVSWTVLAGWVLARREVLFVRHRVVAGWMAVVFSAVMTVSSAVLGWTNSDNSWWMAATATGGTMLVIAILVLQRARETQSALMQRRDALDAALSAGVVKSTHVA